MVKMAINGVTFYDQGSVSIVGNKIILDGKDVTPDSKEINIKIEGNVDRLEIDCCQTFLITGNVGNIKSTSGNVEVSGEVKGSVQTISGDVVCGNVSGNISTISGDVRKSR